MIRWPRPAAPPVIRLEDRYALEYGMPSTHAMVGVAIPFGLLLASLHRYNLILWLSITICIVWTSSICASRLYLGTFYRAVISVKSGGLSLYFGRLSSAFKTIIIYNMNGLRSTIDFDSCWQFSGRILSVDNLFFSLDYIIRVSDIRMTGRIDRFEVHH